MRGPGVGPIGGGLEGPLAATGHSDEEMRRRAYAAWHRLREAEQDAYALGGRELFMLVSCAREVLERRWGRFEC